MCIRDRAEALGGVVEDAVNSVGIDLNTASAPLLSYVSGISSAIAKNIVSYREENGRFTDRKQLKKVSKLGPKAFEQCAGFLRITDGKNILDNTSVLSLIHIFTYHSVAAVFDNNSFSVQFLYVRQGFNKYTGLFYKFFQFLIPQSL